MSEYWNHFHYISMSYVFVQVFRDAELIASIRIEIGATEAVSEAAEAAKLASRH